MKRRTGDTFFIFCLHIVRDKVTVRRGWHVATSAGTWVRRGGATQQENTWTIVHINVDETDPLLPPRQIPTVFWIACTAYHSVYLTISLQTQPWAYLGLGFHIWDQPENEGGGFVPLLGLVSKRNWRTYLAGSWVTMQITSLYSKPSLDLWTNSNKKFLQRKLFWDYCSWISPFPFFS